jgi:hypothetical protein
LQARIAKYEAVYETIADRSLHYVKLIDMTSGRGHMDINRISGYLPGKLVFYLMQVSHPGSLTITNSPRRGASAKSETLRKTQTRRGSVFLGAS